MDWNGFSPKCKKVILIIAIALSVVAVLALITSSIEAEDAQYETWEISMPGVKVPESDTYLCTAMEIPDDGGESYYINGFYPHNSGNAHHLAVYLCNDTDMFGKVWPCHREETIKTLNLSSSDFQPVCKSETMTMYTSGREDTDLALPDNVGFKVGGSEGPSYASLVLQTHYNQPSVDDDRSSVEVKVVRGEENKRMGQIYFLSIGTMPGAEIPPNSRVFIDLVCPIDSAYELHPIAFMPHAHSHGRVQHGYVVGSEGGDWKLIGRGDPRESQVFHRVQDGDLTIHKGDKIASRCAMVNNGSDTVKIGFTEEDEMCTFLILFYASSSSTNHNDAAIEEEVITDEMLNCRRSQVTPWTETFKQSDIPEVASKFVFEE